MFWPGCLKSGLSFNKALCSFASLGGFKASTRSPASEGEPHGRLTCSSPHAAEHSLPCARETDGAGKGGRERVRKGGGGGTRSRASLPRRPTSSCPRSCSNVPPALLTAPLALCLWHPLVPPASVRLHVREAAASGARGPTRKGTCSGRGLGAPPSPLAWPEPVLCPEAEDA